MSLRLTASVGLAAIALGLAGCSSLSSESNAGPCPRAYALYDASRLVEIVGDEVLYSNVGFTGEVENVESFCRYTGDRPIVADLDVELGFGRGPAAEGDTHTYQMFVAVTRADVAVIDKQVFPIEVRFDDDEDRVFIRQSFDRIEIPRASEGISGTNFEILVGFELTEDQLEFNRNGSRFRVDAGQ